MHQIPSSRCFKAQLKQRIRGKACPEKAPWGPAQLHGSPSQIVKCGFSARACKVHMPSAQWLGTLEALFSWWQQKETGIQVIQGKERKGFGGLAWESDAADLCRQPRGARDEGVVPGEAGLEQRRQEARPESLDLASAVAGMVCCGHHSGSGAHIFLFLLLRVFQEGWSC